MKISDVLILVAQATAEPDLEHECVRCHEPIALDDGKDHSSMCHGCAQTVLHTLATWLNEELFAPGTAGHRYRVSRHEEGSIVVGEHSPKMDASHIKLVMTELHAKRLLTELIYAAYKE